MQTAERTAAWRRERRVLRRVSRAAWRLEQAERERNWALASARAGKRLSCRSPDATVYADWYVCTRDQESIGRSRRNRNGRSGAARATCRPTRTWRQIGGSAYVLPHSACHSASHPRSASPRSRPSIHRRLDWSAADPWADSRDSCRGSIHRRRGHIMMLGLARDMRQMSAHRRIGMGMVGIAEGWPLLVSLGARLDWLVLRFATASRVGSA
jgi:hypothetical protein